MLIEFYDLMQHRRRRRRRLRDSGDGGIPQNLPINIRR